MLLDTGPAAWGWDEDQCWTLARITEVVRRRFAVEYTLAGMDLLLHGIGWSAQVPARPAAERDEARIAAWREETWPVIKGRRRTWASGSSSKAAFLPTMQRRSGAGYRRIRCTRAGAAEFPGIVSALDLGRVIRVGQPARLCAR